MLSLDQIQRELKAILAFDLLFLANRNHYPEEHFVVLGKNGNIGRNSFYNPGRQDWTLAVQREFKLRGWEQQAFLFRLEAFNPFNHANLGGGENGIPSVSGDLLSGTFLNTAVTRVGGRNIRLFAKYTF